MHWYHEAEPEVQSSTLVFGDDGVAPAYDTETVFSDATFETASRNSAISENVVYADIVKPKAWIKELSSDEEREGYEDDEENEWGEVEEGQDSTTNSEVPSYNNRFWRYSS